VLQEDVLDATLIYELIVVLIGAVIFQVQGGDMKDSAMRSEGKQGICNRFNELNLAARVVMR
jgi:hypothetical protein